MYCINLKGKASFGSSVYLNFCFIVQDLTIVSTANILIIY